MNKKIIMSLMFILVLAGFVFANMTPYSSDGYNHNVKVYLNKGWNLVLYANLLRDYVVKESEIQKEDILVTYIYSPENKTYLQSYPSYEFSNYLKNLDEFNADYLRLAISPMWIYSNKEGYLEYSRVDVPKFYQVTLISDWNFITITPEMKHLRFNQIKGSCNIEKVCVFQKQEWECFGEELMSHSVEDQDYNIGTGMIVKVSEECRLKMPDSVISEECSDSDGGWVREIKGVTKGFNYEGELVEEEDYCTTPVGGKLDSCEEGYKCMLEEFQCVRQYDKNNQTRMMVDGGASYCEECEMGVCKR